MSSRVLLVLLGVVTGIVMSEAACRVLEARGCREYTDIFWEPNRYYGWGHAPNASGWVQRCTDGRPEWTTHVRINPNGLRERDIPYGRAGEFRILVLGDSFTEGLQVDEDRRWTRLLERRLNHGRRTPQAQVVNSGVGAWGTDNELLFFLREGFRYRPDLVLLQFFTGNDPLENNQLLLAAVGGYPAKPSFTLRDGRLVLEHFPLPPESAIARWLRNARHALRRHLALYRLASTAYLPRVPRRAGAAGPPNTSSLAPYLLTPPPEWAAAWRITYGLVLRLRREVESRGARFAVVVVDSPPEVSAEYWDVLRAFSTADGPYDRDVPNRRITRFLRRRGIPFVSLLEPFRARFVDRSERPYFTDFHWTPVGHAFAADVLAHELRRQGLVPRSSAAFGAGPRSGAQRSHGRRSARKSRDEDQVERPIEPLPVHREVRGADRRQRAARGEPPPDDAREHGKDPMHDDRGQHPPKAERIPA